MAHFATAPDGTSIAYDAVGAGAPALVFVHGWSCNRSYWSNQIASLSASHRIVAMDLAGHGESGAQRSDWSIARFGTDVTAVVDKLALTDIVLVGHSMGANVAVEACRGLTDRVRGLVWVDQHHRLSEPLSAREVDIRLAPFRADFARTTQGFVRGLFSEATEPSLIARVAEHMASAPKEIALRALEATWNYARNVPAALAAVTVPVVAINSQGSPADVASLRRRGVEVVLMPGAGHFPMLEQPREFEAHLVRVIEGFSPRAEG